MSHSGWEDKNMKSALVFTLIVTLIAPSMSFAQSGGERWSAVRNSKPGSEVTVTAQGGPRRRYFIAADNAGVTLLNVSDAALPTDVARTLRRAIAEHPGCFPAPDGVTFRLDDRVSLTAAGVFVSDRKIVEYDQIVERIPRNDVEAGTVLLDVKKEWSNTKQTLVAVGLAVAAGLATVGIVCATQRCD
jgi:hypothetical protein